MKAKSPVISWKEDRLFPAPPEPKGMTLARIGHERWEPSRFFRKSPQRFLAIYVQQGKITCHSRGRELEIPSGSVLLLPPGNDRDLSILESSEIWITVGVGESCFDWVYQVFGSRPLHLSLPQVSRVPACFQALQDTAVRGGQERERRCHLLFEVLLLELQATLTAETQSGGGAFHRWLHCKDFMDAHHTHCRTVQDWANACHIDRSYLSRLARRFAGSTAQHYLQSLRLAEASERLATTHLSITEIAEEGGWSDPFVFSKAYRRRFGVPPSHHRR